MSRLLSGYNNLITSKYGMRTLRGQTKQHNGIDLVGDGGNGVGRVTTIKAHTAGTVSVQGYDKSAGNYVQIDIGNGVEMVYYHMKDNSVKVKRGDKVKKGDIIGYMGATGNVTGAHLHFGIKDNGVWVDPQPYLESDYPVKSEPEATAAIKAGDKLTLSKTPSYSNATTKTVAGYRNGTYYVWSAEVVNGRVRVTNKPERVGVKGQVTCWINVADIKDTAKSKTFKLTKDCYTFWAVSRKFGCTVDDIQALNPTLNPNNLRIGQVINVPSR